MKCLLIFVAAIATLLSGVACLECEYCYGRDCNDPSNIGVETCRSRDEVTSTTAATGSSSPSGTAAANETTSEAAENTTASTTTTATTTTTTTATKLRHHSRPSWGLDWGRGVQPVCMNATRIGWFGRQVYRGCAYMHHGVDPCRGLLRYGLATTCNTCTTNRCN